MLAQEQLDIVSVTTRPEERAEIVIATTESGGVKAIYATKPMCSSLAEADAMIGLVVNTGVILAIACHKNWSPWFQACLQAIAEGQIGSRPPCCVSFTHGGHTLSLFRLFAGAPASWVIGHQGGGGRRQGGMILYQNGIRGFITIGGWFNFDFVGSDG